MSFMKVVSRHKLNIALCTLVAVLVGSFVASKRENNMPYFEETPVSIVDSTSPVGREFTSTNILLDSESRNKAIRALSVTFDTDHSIAIFKLDYGRGATMKVKTTYQKEKNYYLFMVQQCDTGSMLVTCPNPGESFKFNIARSDRLILRSKFEIFTLVSKTE